MRQALGWWKQFKSEAGVLTVEALLVIPIICFCFIWMLALLQMVGQYLNLDCALSAVSKDMTNSAYTIHQGVAQITDQDLEDWHIPDILLKQWADACLEKHLSNYQQLKPALKWQMVRLPPILGQEENRSEDDVRLSLEFWPSKVNIFLAAILPENLNYILVKQQKAWLIGRDLLPYRGLEQSAAKQSNGFIVYITRWGTRYHRNNCRYLAKSKIICHLNELDKFYLPCKVCQPPIRE